LHIICSFSLINILTFEYRFKFWFSINDKQYVFVCSKSSFHKYNFVFKCFITPRPVTFPMKWFMQKMCMLYICICICTMIETSHCPYSLIIYVCLVLLTAIEWCKDHFFISKVFIGQAIYVLWKHCRGPYSLVLPAYWKQSISILLAFGWLDQGSNLW
jgi:hypothetical protein